MTLEQCLKSILDKKSQITKLEGEIRERKEQLKQLCPLKIGDVVIVDGKEKLWISDVEYDYWKPHYRYKFNKIKKDGTKGNQDSGIYSYKTIELYKGE